MTDFGVMQPLFLNRETKSTFALRLAFCFILLSALYTVVGSEVTWRQDETTSQEPQNQSMSGRPFEADDIRIGPFFVLHRSLPKESCASLSVQYQAIIPTGKGTYRVPHSRILMDEKQCGTLGENATEDDLWVDNHMELIPVDFLANESITREHDTNAAYVKLHQRRFPLAFYDFSLKERYQKTAGSNTWIGFERQSDRVCGDENFGQVRLPQNTIIFFGKSEDIRINLTDLISRVPHPVVLERQIPYQISFIDPGDGSDEHICPQVFTDPSRQEEPGTYRMCFPAASTVQLSTGDTIPMSDLRIGDRVLDASGGYSAVYMFSHRSSTIHAEFVTVHTDTDRALTLSPGHYVHTPTGITTAAAIRVGDMVHTTSGTRLITKTERTRARGLYNPHTVSGNLVVDGIVASVYTNAVEPKVAHALLAPLRSLFLLAGARKQTQQILSGMLVNGTNDSIATLVPKGADVMLAAAVASVISG